MSRRSIDARPRGYLFYGDTRPDYGGIRNLTMLRRFTSCCLLILHRSLGYGRPWGSGRQLSVCGAQWSLSSSTRGANSGGGGEEVVYVPGYEKVDQLKQSVWHAILKTTV